MTKPKKRRADADGAGRSEIVEQAQDLGGIGGFFGQRFGELFEAANGFGDGRTRRSWMSSR